MRFGRSALFLIAIFPLCAQSVLKIESDPFVKHVQTWQPPVYPRKSVEEGHTGLVIAKIRVNTKGRVSSVDILSAPDAHMAETVRSVISQWIFQPFAEDGVPRPAESVIYLDYRLQPEGPNVTIPGLTKEPVATVEDPFKRPSQ